MVLGESMACLFSNLLGGTLTDACVVAAIPIFVTSFVVIATMRWLKKRRKPKDG